MNEQHLEKIIESALIANRSAIWWQTEMNFCLSELAKLEKDENIYGGELISPQKEETQQRVEYLIKKGQWEDKNLDSIMSQLESFEDKDKRHVVSEISKRWQAMMGHNDPPY